MSQKLPPNPSLDNLRRRAKRLLRDFRSADEDAVRRFQRYFPADPNPTPDHSNQIRRCLRDAQYVLACEHGYRDWAQLSHVVGLARRIYAQAQAPSRPPEYRFSRLTGAAMQTARKWAALLHHRGIGPELVLLGILDDPSSGAAKTLTGLGHDHGETVAALRCAIVSLSQPIEGHTSPRVNTILERASGVAKKRSTDFVETGDLLVALARDSSFLSARFLEDLGFDVASIEEHLEVSVEE